jgi:hypothetical protein
MRKREIERIRKLVDKMNEVLGLEDSHRLKFITAGYVDKENSNLQQCAEILTPEAFRFVKFLWMSKKPYEFGIALYERVWW